MSQAGPDPVSWLMIEPGWTVETADAQEAGRVLEITGDSSHDIFDGLVVASGAVARPRYVPAEQVGEIVPGRVRLNLDQAAVDALPEYSEPPEEMQIEGGKASRLERAKTWAAPTDHRGRIGLLRRVLLWFGIVGKR